MTHNKSRISIVIPVYFNQGSLLPTFNSVSKVLSEHLSNPSIEFIFINDGSTDESLNQLLELSGEGIKIQIISLSRNFGQVYAIIAGLEAATGDAVVIMSADQQEPPEIISQMIDNWLLGSEIVIGHRIERNDGFFKDTTSRLFYGLMTYLYPRMPKGGFDYIFLGRDALIALLLFKEKNPFFQGNILSLGFPTTFIPYIRKEREIGSSKWTFWKRFKYSVDAIIASSYIPVRCMSLAGVLCALAGFIYSIVIVIARILGFQPFIGWAPLMIVILFVGGLIMLMLGVLGEYIWRIYDEVRARPRFIVEKRWNK